MHQNFVAQRVELAAKLLPGFGLTGDRPFLQKTIVVNGKNFTYVNASKPGGHGVAIAHPLT